MLNFRNVYFLFWYHEQFKCYVLVAIGYYKHKDAQGIQIVKPLKYIFYDASPFLWLNFRFCFSSSFLTSSHRLLQCSSPEGSGAGTSSYGLSSLPPSPQPESSRGSSALPSPGASASIPEYHLWACDPEPTIKGQMTLFSAPSPAALQDTSSQDTQSSGEYSGPILLTFFFCVCRVFRNLRLCLSVWLFVLALAHDGDSVIFVKEQQGKKSETSR